MYGKVLFNYTSNNSNIEDKDDYEVDLFEGSFVEIMEMYDDGWWLVQTKSKAGVPITGLAPSNYIELENDSNSKLDHSPKQFTNTANATTVWRELPPGWKEAVDAKSNDTYYYNSSTGAVQWNFPHKAVQQPGSSELVQDRLQNFSPEKIGATSSSLQHAQAGEEWANEGKNKSSAAHPTASAARLRTVRQVLSPTISSRSMPGSPPHSQGLDVAKHRAADEGRADDKDMHRSIDAEAEAEVSPGDWSREPLQGTASASDLRRLRHLREQAEQKINALRLAVSSHENSSTLKKTATLSRHQPVTQSVSSPAEDASSDPAPSARTERSEQGQVRVHSAKQKRGKRKEAATPTLPQVSLDPKSLSFISQIVTERIEKEFSLRDGALLDQVRALIQQQQHVVALPAIANPGPHPNPNPPPLLLRREEESVSVGLPALSVPKRQSPYLKAVRRDADRDTARDGDKEAAADRGDPRSAAARLSLSHCFGYDGDVSRHGHSVQGRNLLLLPLDQGDQLLLFPAAAMVVLMSLHSKRQRFFTAHNDDVTCIAAHPDLKLVASGQKGREGGVVLVWNPQRPEQAAAARLVPPACVSRGICSVSFSATSLLAAMSLEEARSLFIFDFKAAALLATVKVGQVDAGQVLFNPTLFSAMSCHVLASFGGKHVKFWALRCEAEADKDSFDDVSSFKGRKLKGRRPNPNPAWQYTLEGSTGSIPSGGAIGDAGTCRWISGSSSGSILLWQQIEDERSTAATGWLWRGKARLLAIVTEAHDSPVLCLDLLALRPGPGPGSGPQEIESSGGGGGGELTLASSGADGLVSLWQVSAAPAHKVRATKGLPLEHLLSLELPAGDASRAICWQSSFPSPSSSSSSSSWPSIAQGLRAVVGTVQNNIHVLTYLDRAAAEAAGTPQQQQQQQQAVSGEGGGVAQLQLLQSGHAGKVKRLCVHPTRPWLFLSLSADGSLRMWHAGAHSQLQSDNLTGEGRVATSCAFSPDGRLLAVGDDSGQVSLLDNSWLHRVLDSEDDLTCDGDGDGDGIGDWRLLGRRSLLAHPPAAASAATPPSSSRGRGGPGKGASPSAPSPSASSSDKNHSRRSGSGSGLLGLGQGGNIGAIVAIQFCRVTSLLAASCSQHNLIHLLRLESQGQVVTLRRLCVCRGHTSPARSLDFSSDGCTLLSSDTREVFFWDSSSGSRRLSRERDEVQQWQSWSSNIGSPVAGAANTTTVEPGAAGATGSGHPGDVNCVARSPDSRLLAVGCSQVRAVKLFSYPCPADAVPCAYGGHASPVVDIAFVHTSMAANSPLAVISAGGNDCCILQWEVQPLQS